MADSLLGKITEMVRGSSSDGNCCGVEVQEVDKAQTDEGETSCCSDKDKQE